jgi:hypothetical protein
MVNIILLLLRLEPIAAHRFELAVIRRSAGPIGSGTQPRRLANCECRIDRTGMSARSRVCHRSRSHSLEQYGPTQSCYQGNGREGTP